MEISWQVISPGAAFSIQGTLEDPNGIYPSPASSAPTAFTLYSGSSNILFSLGSSATLANQPVTEPITAWRLSVSSGSSQGAVTAVVLQSGIG
jgi:hypothetical protein